MLNKIIINNYKIFGGLHEIVLSTEKECPFTIIAANNASGKTTIVDAILWCLGETCSLNVQSRLLNIEVEQSLTLGETIDVSVELLFEIQGKDFSVKRVSNLRKNIIDCSVTKDYFFVNETKYAYDSFKAYFEKYFPFWRFTLTMWDERIGFQAFSRRLQKEVCNYVKNDICICNVFKRIETEANNIFESLCYRNGRFRILWNKDTGFEVLTMYNDEWESYAPSSTFVTAVNVAITVAAYHVLAKGSPWDSFSFFIVDDFLLRTDKKQFSINEVCEVLFPNQTLLLLHQNSLEGAAELTVNRFGKQYSMYRTRDWTNVEINEII